MITREAQGIDFDGSERTRPFAFYRWGRTAGLVVMAVLLLVVALEYWPHKTPVAAGEIAFMGDSITAGYGLAPGEAYPAFISIPGMRVQNLGVSGSTSANGLKRLRDYFAGGAHPTLVVIALGANDILQGIPTELTEANLNDSIHECQRHGAAVMLCGVKIPFKFDISEIYAHVAAKNRVPLVPDILMGEAFETDLMQDDHMHPTADGQKVIAGRMQAALLRNFTFGR